MRLVREKVYIEELITKDLDLFDQIENFVVREKGDLITSPDGTTLINLPIGPNGSFLKADSSTLTGLKWDATVPSAPVLTINGEPLIPPAIPPVPIVVNINDVTPTLNKGELMVGDGSNLVAQPIGTDGYAIILNSGTATGLEWAEFSGDIVTLVNGNVGIVVLTFDDFAPGGFTKGDFYVNNGTSLTSISVGSDDQVLTADSTQAAGIRWENFPPNNVDSVNGKTGDVVLTLDDFVPFPLSIGQLMGELGGAAAPIPILPTYDDFVLTVDSTQLTGVAWKSRFDLQKEKSFRLLIGDGTNFATLSDQIVTNYVAPVLLPPFEYYNGTDNTGVTVFNVAAGTGGANTNKFISGIYKLTLILNFSTGAGYSYSDIEVKIFVNGNPGSNVLIPRIGDNTKPDKVYIRYENIIRLEANDDIDLRVSDTSIGIGAITFDLAKTNVFGLQFLGN